MLLDNKVYVGYADGEKVCINLSKANRHGLIAGATGTGKTTTLRVIAESFSNAGVPVFLADAKGDLATLCQPGTMVEPVQKRMDEMGLAGSDRARAGDFMKRLQSGGIPVTLRRKLGASIDGACGQLRSRKKPTTYRFKVAR